MKELISVIIPVYKVEQYLNKCVQSVIGQTYKNLEIILVDDGSPDNCPQMCDDWAKKDDRIKVVHKKNGGLSDARNAGIEICTGKYISFIDSDDYIHQTMIEKLYNLLQTNKTDISICGYKKVYEEDNDFSCEPVKEASVIKVYSGQQNFDLIEEFNVNTVVAWAKLYKRKIFETLRYPVGKIYEDGYVVHKYLFNAKSVVYSNEPLYFYLQRQGSIMAQNTKKIKESDYDAFIERVEFFEKNGIEKKYIVQTYSNLLDAIMFAYRKRAKKQPEARKLLVKLFNVNYAKFKTIKKETKLKLSFKFRLKTFLFKYFRFIFNFV